MGDAMLRSGSDTIAILCTVLHWLHRFNHGGAATVIINKLAVCFVISQFD